MLTLSNVPLSIFNRALDLFSVERESTIEAAVAALSSAESRKEAPGVLAPFAQALAEYLSAAGPWAEDGEFAHESGFYVELPSTH